MIPFEAAWRLAGWTMIHFVWVGAAIALFTLAVRLVLRRASPNLRYVVTLAAFAAITLAPLAIAGWLVTGDTLSVAQQPPAPVISDPIAAIAALPAGDAAPAEPVTHEPWLPP